MFPFAFCDSDHAATLNILDNLIIYCKDVNHRDGERKAQQLDTIHRAMHHRSHQQEF